MDKINKYLNPPELSVEQVMETPQKATVTVKGILRNVSNIIPQYFLNFFFSIKLQLIVIAVNIIHYITCTSDELKAQVSFPYLYDLCLK